MPTLVVIALAVIAFTGVSLVVSQWFTNRALGAERPSSFEDVAILQRGADQADEH